MSVWNRATQSGSPRSTRKGSGQGWPSISRPEAMAGRRRRCTQAMDQDGITQTKRQKCALHAPRMQVRIHYTDEAYKEKQPTSDKRNTTKRKKTRLERLAWPSSHDDQKHWRGAQRRGTRQRERESVDADPVIRSWHCIFDRAQARQRLVSRPPCLAGFATAVLVVILMARRMALFSCWLAPRGAMIRNCRWAQVHTYLGRCLYPPSPPGGPGSSCPRP